MEYLRYYSLICTASWVRNVGGNITKSTMIRAVSHLHRSESSDRGVPGPGIARSVTQSSCKHDRLGLLMSIRIAHELRHCWACGLPPSTATTFPHALTSLQNCRRRTLSPDMLGLKKQSCITCPSAQCNTGFDPGDATAAHQWFFTRI
ncbi:unnamed protein product [Cercospora beticola]|nr:unnamed protein product [Cercospora beticola]